MLYIKGCFTKKGKSPPFHFGMYKIVFTQEICLLIVILLSSYYKEFVF